MKGIVLDTTIKRAYVAAFDDEREAVRFFDASLSTESALIPACEQVLNDLSLRKPDLDGICAVVGPGSFTGIRIGVTFANALAYALSLPRFSLTSFDVMNAIAPDAPAFSVAAGHGSYYAALRKDGVLFEKNMGEAELPIGTIDQSSLLNDLPRGALIAARRALDEKHFSFCALTHETEYLKPNYMRKSQAERLRDEKNDR